MFMRERGSELWTRFVFIIKFEGLNPFYSILPLLIYRIVSIVAMRIGSAKGCIVPALFHNNVENNIIEER
jgi:hypothetical protein